MANNKSMVDVAFDLMSKKKRAMPFIKLWTGVSEATGASSDDVAQFYTDLTLDSRFVSLEGNKWDLRSRRSFLEAHPDIALIDDDDDDYRDDDISEEYYDA